MSGAVGRPYVESFWACFSPADLCLKSCCCPCFVYGQNHHRIKTGGLDGYESMNGGCAGWAALQYCCGFGWLLQFLDREKLREKHGLEGSSLTSCLGSCCCACCELMQTKKELDYISINQDSSKISPPGYNQQPDMVAEPQQPAQPQYNDQPLPENANTVNGVNYANGNGAPAQDAIVPQQMDTSVPMIVTSDEKTATGHNC